MSGPIRVLHLEPDAHEALSSTPNITALRASATHSALRYLGSTVGAAEQWPEQQ